MECGGRVIARASESMRNHVAAVGDGCYASVDNRVQITVSGSQVDPLRLFCAASLP